MKLHYRAGPFVFRNVLGNGIQFVDAATFTHQRYPQVKTSQHLLIVNLSVDEIAEQLPQIKQNLLCAYPPAHQVALIFSHTTENQQVETISLDRLGMPDVFDNPSSLASLAIPPLEEYGRFHALQEIVAHLRAPDGCPWNREQTLLTLREGLLNECHEGLEALDIEEDGVNNREHIIEELGDMFLVPTMMVQIASEEKRFQMADVMRGIVTKLIRRHPHVFSTVDVENVDEILTNWDAIKAKEKADRGDSERGPLDGIPEALPALEKARKLQSKATKAGLLDQELLASTVTDTLMQFESVPNKNLSVNCSRHSLR